MKKIKLCVLFGGKSTEYEVSLASAYSVLVNLDSEKYDIVTIGITKEGKWLLYSGDYESIKNDSWHNKNVTEAIISPDCTEKCVIITKINEKIKIDVAFPVIHGNYGEDGSLQGLFKLSGIPYVGPQILASAAGLDKAVSKVIFKEANIPQSDYLVLHKADFDNMENAINVIESKINYPIFVKPANTGSSVGISKAHNKNELTDAVYLALNYDKKLVFEQFINCRELEVAVIGNDKPLASCVGEVVPSKEFYDYEAKYQDDNVKIIIPAQIDEKTEKTIKDYAIKAYIALGCVGFSRVDFFMCKDSSKIYINEINTIPGFTSVSMYPMLWQASGISYGELLDNLINLAME